MPNIFISYRREDSLGHTGRLFDRLGKHFGRAHVFMDIAGIEPGLDFVEAIDKAVGSCDVFIVVIGKQWLNASDADGRRRLDNPEDFIRLELATALKRNIRVIPVLVQGAIAPNSENLPEDLKMLSRRQAIEVSDNRWDFDAGELIKTIEKSLKTKYPLRFWWSKIPRWAIVVCIVILFSIGVTLLSPPGPQKELGIEMPNVVGVQFEKAKALLAEKGLEVLKIEKQTDEKPSGTVLDQNPGPGKAMGKGQRVELVIASKPIMAIDPYKQMARKLGDDWYTSISRKDAMALARMASLPFFFDNEVLLRLEDIENRWRDAFSQTASKGEDPKAWHLKEIKVQTIAEWKRGGYDVSKDRFLTKMEHKDDDFMIGISVEKDTHKHGQLLYTRNVGGQIKLAGFWD